MLYQLTSEDYYRIQPLFHDQSNHHLFCAGVLAGKYSGQVLVNDLERPQTALVSKGGTWCYMGGNPHNDAFNDALRTELVERHFIDKNLGALLITIPSEEWRYVLDTLVAERVPIEMPRRLYIASGAHFEPQASLPEAFTLHFMDESLLSRIKGGLPGDAQDVLKLRAQANNPDEMAFGYVAVQQDGTYAAWAMVDCIVDSKGEIGLFTESAFRQQGLATAVSAATIAYALAHGLTAVHWDCHTYNFGSVRIAEKLGLRLALEHTLYLIIFSQGGHLLNAARSALQAGRFQTTLDLHDRVLALDIETGYGYFLASSAWAGLNHKEEALRCLYIAAEKGWGDVAETEHCPPLKNLQSTPEWEDVMARIRSNASIAN